MTKSYIYGKGRIENIYTLCNNNRKGNETVPKLEWGTKRVCQGCGARFYDLCRVPAVCPKCGEIFEIQTSSRSRKGRAAMEEEKLVIPTLDDLQAVDVIGVPEDIEAEIEDADRLLEDTTDLDEGLEDIPQVIEHIEKEKE